MKFEAWAWAPKHVRRLFDELRRSQGYPEVRTKPYVLGGSWSGLEWEGYLWELHPAEVVSRFRPAAKAAGLSNNYAVALKAAREVLRAMPPYDLIAHNLESFCQLAGIDSLTHDHAGALHRGAPRVSAQLASQMQQFREAEVCKQVLTQMLEPCWAVVRRWAPVLHLEEIPSRDGDLPQWVWESPGVDYAQLELRAVSQLKPWQRRR